MLAFCFHCPRFWRFRRSRSYLPNSSPPSPHYVTPTSHPSGPDPSRTSFPPPSSVLRALEQDVNVTPVSCASAPGNPIPPQNSTERIHVDGIPTEFSASPSQVLRLVPPIIAIDSDPEQRLRTSGSAAQQSCPPNPTDCTHSQQSQVPQYSPCPFNAAPLQQQSWNSQSVNQFSSQYLPLPEHQHRGMFNQAHDFTVIGTFIEANVMHSSDTTSNRLMENLLKETIPGAASDSSARDPPPRCHPGTRLAILDRCLSFIRNCDGQRKIRWVVGAAGVGKSAVMQSVAESPDLPVSCHASVFFSVNGRNDGTKAIITISYQIAAKCEPYRQLIEKEIARDPSLLRSSMTKQFLKFITEPFIHNSSLDSVGRALIIMDGLDECSNLQVQLELLRLISDFCIQYPSSPLVWLVASRPEAHITSFFSRGEVMPAYVKEEMPVNSDEARADVERFLRDALKEITRVLDSLDPLWPEERDLWKLANASGGLFAFAQTVIRYIGDSTIGSPASQLSDVMNVIDKNPMLEVPREDHPLALLDTLYARILSNIPSRIMMNTRKLLLALVSNWDQLVYGKESFVVLCNWLGLTPAEAYAAINHLRSVLLVPRPDNAHKECLIPFHKSFIDYISAFDRSEFSPNIQVETQQLKTECAFRILKQAPDGIDFGDTDYKLSLGTVMRGPGTGDKISLTWLVAGDAGWSNNETKLSMYKLAIAEVVVGMKRGDPAFQDEFCINILATRFERYGLSIPHYDLRDLVFDESRCHEFMARGILKEIPFKEVHFSKIFGFLEAKLQFRCSGTTATHSNDPWNVSCKHKRYGQWKGGQVQEWTTAFHPKGCAFCCNRLQRQLENWKIRSPEHVCPVLFTSTGTCCVEFRFVDPVENDGSEWVYWFWYRLSLEERKKYGSLV